MAVRRVDEVGVDLVGDHDQVVTRRDLGEALELGPGEHVPGRVVRVTQDHQARRFASKRGVECVVVERRRDPDDPPLHGVDRVQERVVRGCVEHDAVAGIGQMVHGDANSLHDVAHLVQPGRLRGPPIAARHPLDERDHGGRHTALATPRRIANIGLRHLDQPVADDRRDREVHVGDPGRVLGRVELPLGAGPRSRLLDRERAQPERVAHDI